MTFNEKVIALDGKLKEIALLEAEIKQKREAFEESIKDAKSLKNVYALEANNLKKDITEEGVKLYEADNSHKEFYGGLKIRNTKELVYTKEEAVEWAKKSESCLTLDKKAFDAVAKTGTLDFVIVRTIPTVTFPKEIKLED